VAKLEYELECSRAHASELGQELRDAKASLAKTEESRDLYKERCKLQEKEIFALERQNEETKKGFDTGMAVAKRQIKMLEEMLDEAKKGQEGGSGRG
jgi:predicted  nucleic acid-binding Zn-ribbon protein